MAMSRSDNSFDLECCQLLLLTILSSILIASIAIFFPADRPVDEVISLTFASSYGWVLAQAFFVTLPVFCLFGFLCRWKPRYTAFVGKCMLLALPWIYLCDVLVFTWIGDRLLSPTMAHILKSLLPALALHITQSAMMQAIALLVIGFIVSFACVKISRGIASRWINSEESISTRTALCTLLVIAVGLSIHPLRNWETIESEMQSASRRHPFCAFHIVGFRGTGLKVSSQTIAASSRLRALESIDAVQKRELEMLELTCQAGLQDGRKMVPRHPKVILVVVECLRPEVISPELMPNLHAFSQKAIYCQNHFTGGNSTCLGMFSLFNGLESIWFHREINEQPIYNRLMRQAGYQLGFFGGQTDWRIYDMDGFVNESQYDAFVIEDPDLPVTDLNAVRRTLAFIDDDKGMGASKLATKDSESSLRSAVCYLYATHSSFRYSAPEYRVFTPEADEGLLISNAPELKEQFYNRYKNSLRSMDDILSPLLREDCVVIVMGDHGEPFLDDGTASHGTRLSRYQNMTPAVIYYPGVQPKTVTEVSFHADILPTLFSILGINVTNEHVFDGVDLISSSMRELQQRIFVTGNFMDATSLLVGPWTNDPDRPFGHRVVHDIHQWQASYLNPVDDLGYELDSESAEGREFYRSWMIQRFGRELIGKFNDIDLFRKCFKSVNSETRMEALKIAEQVPEPSEELIRLVETLLSDEDPMIREKAKRFMISLSRGRSWLSLLN